MRAAPAQPGLERMEAFFAGHAFDPHRHDSYALGLTISGVQSFDYRGQRADSLAGCAILLHPDERHDGRAGAETGFRYRMLYLEPRVIRDALNGRAANLPFARAAVTSNPRVVSALRRMLDDLDRALEPLEADQAIAAIADALLALDPSAQRRSERRYAHAAGVERARDFLAAHCARVVSSDEIEAVSGLDRFALTRQFRAQLGASPYRYLTMRRLERAKALMRAGETMANAAIDCGFSDQSHFTRQFKQAFGLSPGRWRDVERGGAPAN